MVQHFHDGIVQISRMIGREVATPDVPATSHPVPMSNVMRDDVPVTPLPVADVLAAAPDARDGQFGVPQILEEDA